MNSQSERLWRVRRQGASMDARIAGAPAAVEVELQYFQDGRLIVATRWPSRAAALADADAKLRDLQRAGWTTHW
jgi:hypothetical protein